LPEQVLYGMDYVAGERRAQQGALRAAVLAHLSRHPDALLVVEEYDKLDCPTRGFLRQLLERGHGGNVTADRQLRPWPLCTLALTKRLPRSIPARHCTFSITCEFSALRRA
jgi:hypothetical protein